MSVTVIRNPLGHKLTGTELDGSITDSSGEALVTTIFSHGLVDGDYVYIQSNIESYNGFKYVDQTAYNTFKIRNSENSAAVAYKQDADILYQVSVLQHGWQCVHLPIVYELESDIYPTNQGEEDYAYPARVVVSQSENDGYTQLELNSALPSPMALGWISLVGTGPLAGVYQIIEVLQPWSIVIDLAYDVTNSFSGYAVVTYYNNYCINVNIYSGLPSGHRWEDEKPYELLATLQLIPDENNRVLFSINEILRGAIETRNNLTLDTLPNNLDFLTGFYISYFESYDQSDGDEITTFEGEVTIDSFEGFAVNAKLPFKSESISHMSDYLNSGTYYAQWLTLQTTPLAIVGYFFDISFINQYLGGDITITVNGVTDQTITNPGLGIIRVPLEFLTAGEYCVYASWGGVQILSLSSLTLQTGSGDTWTTGSAPSVSTSGSSKKLYKSFPAIPGVAYQITVNSNVTGSIGAMTIQAGFLNLSLGVEDSDSSFILATGANTDVLDLVATADSVYLYFLINESLGGTVGFTFTSVSIETDPARITEDICITVLEECDDTVIADDNIRLTEDGDFRILE